MAEATLTVIYPIPTDVDEFERRYSDEHVPMAVNTLTGVASRGLFTKVIGSPSGPAPYHRMAHIVFSGMEVLQQAAATEPAQALLGHAAEISTGGPPVILIGETDAVTF
jgi:uncharacterized protein (TIGR02118 family)